LLSDARHAQPFEEELRLADAERAGQDPWVEPTLDSFGVA
jgi:hypothetical protein